MADVVSALFFCLLLIILSVSKDLITAAEETVTLHCRSPHNKPVSVVEWTRGDLEPYVLLHRDGHYVPDGQHPSFKNRVKLQDSQMKDGDVSLVLKDVTTGDSGTYKCHVYMKENLNGEVIETIKLVVINPGQPGWCKELAVPLVLLILGGFVVFWNCR
ncbi:butyrophilin subfamily 2 member A2-like [Pholidichthys leucotaenia]